MAKKAEQKPLYRSLTVQSGVGLSVLILARVLLPYINWEVPDELFQSLLALLLGAGTVGLRRSLPGIALVLCCVLPLGIIQCGPSICKKATITITDHPTLPSPPAGTVTVDCDGKTKAEIHAEAVKK